MGEWRSFLEILITIVAFIACTNMVLFLRLFKYYRINIISNNILHIDIDTNIKYIIHIDTNHAAQ